MINTDAMKFLAEGDEPFDVVIVDFPDPNNFSLGKLYTTGFYKLLKRRMAPDGVAVVQSTSPLFARRSFWCVDATLRAAGLWTEPYHALVPSFGEWGYVLVAHEEPGRHRPLPEGLKFVDEPDAGAAAAVSSGHGAPARGGEPAEQPGAGSLLRGGVAAVELTRRELVAAFLGSAVAASACKRSRARAPVPGEIIDRAVDTGHRLRGGPLPRAEVAGAGGGADRRARASPGLSAAWRLAGRA